MAPFRTSCCSKYFFSRACHSTDEILDSLGPSDESFDKIVKVETIEKCKDLNSTSLKDNITLVVSMDAENFTYLSVYHGKKQSCPTKSFFCYVHQRNLFTGLRMLRQKNKLHP